MPEPSPYVFCPLCRKRFRVQGGKPGREFRCPTPGCGNMLAVPVAPPLPPPPQQEVFDLDDPDDAPAPPRPVAQKRLLVPEDLDDEPPPRPRRLPVKWVAGVVAGVALLGGIAGAGYWVFGGRSARDGSGGGSGVTASGPRVTLLEKLPDRIKVRRYYVTGEFAGHDHFDVPTEDWSQTLPTGTESIHVGIAFAFEPPNGTKLEIETESESGPVKLAGGLMITIRGPEGTTVELVRESPSGPFPDGRYETTVKIDGTPAARLNWAVGEQVAGVPAAGLKGTKWRQRGGPDSGYRLEFRADGTLSLEELWNKGVKHPGKWQADGTTFTGHVERPKENGGRMEFRGQCLKDELRVRSRHGEGRWYALGVFVPDDGKSASTPAGSSYGGFTTAPPAPPPSPSESLPPLVEKERPPPAPKKD